MSAATPPEASLPILAGMPSAFILRVPFVTRAPSQRRPLVMVLVGMLVALLALLVPAARADTVPVKSAELRIEEGEVLLNAEFDLNFNPTLEEALQKGIPLYIVLEFELTLSRWYWLDEKVAQTTLTSRVS